MKTLAIGTYYQILNLLRVKKAVFFSFIFPAFIFILFSIVWGNGNVIFTKYLLTGTVVLTIASDAIFSIGAVISGYYLGGEIKLFKVLPYNFNKHIIALILSRIFVLIIAISLLILMSIIFFNLRFSISELGYIFLGVIIGTLLFSYIGIVVASIAKEDSKNSSLTNIVFYAMIFLSDCFFPLSEFKESLSKVAQINPFNPILELTRGSFNFLPIIIWLIVLVICQTIQIRMIQLKR